MKKLFLVLTSVLFIFASCNKDEASEPDNSGSGNNDAYDYGLFAVKHPTPLTRGAAVNSYLWEAGDTIIIKFLGGTAAQQQMVRQYSVEWLEYANLHFEFVGDEVANNKADIRIDFDGDYAFSWTRIGTDARNERTKNPTAVFGKLSPMPQKARLQIIRVFGRILGLVNEHYNPEQQMQLDLDAIEQWYHLIEDWDEFDAYDFFFEEFDDLINTAYDPNSIMIWPLASEFTLNGVGISGSANFSEMDKEFVSRLYPDERVSVIKAVREKSLLYHYHSLPPYEHSDYYTIDFPAITLWAWTWKTAPGESRYVLNFDLKDLKDVSQIENVTLNLYSWSLADAYGGGAPYDGANNGGNNAFYVQQISEPWEIEALKWANQPVVRRDNRARVPHTNLYVLDVQVDVTDMVKDMVENNSNYGFLLQLENPVRYTSRNFHGPYEGDGYDPSKVPTLNITYK